MNHLFIINPAAGSRDRTADYTQTIEKICSARGITYRIAVSQAPGDCTRIAREAAQSGEEYRLYAELKRAISDTTINDEDNNLGFAFGDFMMSFDDGKISVSKDKSVFAQYEISDFSRSPNAVFRQMQKDMAI